MTPTDLELRRMVAEAHGWRDVVIANKNNGLGWESDCFGRSPDRPDDVRRIPAIEKWAWPCLLELTLAGQYLYGLSAGYQVVDVGPPNEATTRASDPDPARAVILAWLKFKENNRSAERAGR